MDPSLAVALLGAGAERLLKYHQTLGLLFEALAIRDLRVYAAVHRASVCHYRDETGLEVDAIVEAIDGRWIACEVKLGSKEAIEAAASNLIKLREKLQVDQRSRLGGLVVITASKVALIRPGGVYVVPLGLLKP